MDGQRPSQWPVLFDLAINIFDHVHNAHGLTPHWSLGGGTALMLRIDHRESHDIDIFLDDPQILPFLNPETQSYALSHRPDSYRGDGTSSLKLTYENIGEIDFICCGSSILEDGYDHQTVRGRDINLERPNEIIAKKVFFRGSAFQPRDMFDLAAVVEHCGNNIVVDALRQCGKDRCVNTLDLIEKTNPAAVEAIIGQLMYRDNTAHLVQQAREISRRTLLCVI